VPVIRVRVRVRVRVRDPPAQTIIVPTIKFAAYYRYGLFLTRSFFGLFFWVFEIAFILQHERENRSMDSHSF
jgi:hypothetical protein